MNQRILELAEPPQRKEAGMNDIIETARAAGVHPLAITGLTIRDYFAAAVAQGIWANANVLSRLTKGNQAQDIAAVVYEQADAMLKERRE